MMFRLYILICAFIIWPERLKSIKCRPQKINNNNNNNNNNNIKNNNNNNNTEINKFFNKTKTRILTHGNINRGDISEYIDHDIIFPDAYNIVFEEIPKLNTKPDCAKDDENFCEEYDKYPYKQISNVLKRNHIRNDLFGEDQAPDLINRIGEIEEHYVCESVERTVFPKVAKNKNNEWKYIINQGDSDEFIQGVRVEICQRVNEPCAIIGELPSGYVTSCKQKFIYRRMMSLTDNGQPSPDSFQLPSACCCSYKKDIDFLRRAGIISKKSLEN